MSQEFQARKQKMSYIKTEREREREREERIHIMIVLGRAFVKEGGGMYAVYHSNTVLGPLVGPYTYVIILRDMEERTSLITFLIFRYYDLLIRSF